MFCLKCGIQLPDTAQFCAKCGTRTIVPMASNPIPTENNRTATQQHNAAIQNSSVPNNDQSSLLLKSLSCPQCNANIEAEDGLDMFFCKYCGNKIILSGQSDAAYNAKAKMHENQLKYQAAQERRLQKEKAEKEDFKEMVLLVIFVLGFGIIALLLAILG